MHNRFEFQVRFSFYLILPKKVDAVNYKYNVFILYTFDYLYNCWNSMKQQLVISCRSVLFNSPKRDSLRAYF